VPVVDVLKELLPGQIAAMLHDPREAAIVDVDRVPLATLAAEHEPQRRPAHVDVLVLQRRQAERAVRLDVFLVADANAAALEQLHDRGEDLVAGQARLRQIDSRTSADLRERRGKVEHPVVLRLVTGDAPLRVIAVLFSPACVAPRRLHVAARIGADPHVCPCRRNSEPGNPLHLRRTTDAPTGAVVLESKPPHFAADPRTIVGDVAKACRARRLHRIERHGSRPSEAESSLARCRSGPRPVTVISFRTSTLDPTIARASSSARDRFASVSVVPMSRTPALS
jgi:hypothetical protein